MRVSTTLISIFFIILLIPITFAFWEKPFPNMNQVRDVVDTSENGVVLMYNSINSKWEGVQLNITINGTFVTYPYLYSNYYTNIQINTLFYNKTYIDTNYYTKAVTNSTGLIGLTCADGEILEFETSTGLWECGTDSSGVSEEWVEEYFVPYTGATGDVDLNNKDLVNINNVGIGTSNPTFPNRDSKLVIEGSGTGTTGRTAFVVRNTATDSASSFILANSDENTMSAQVSGSSYVGGEKAGFSTTGLNLSFGVDGNMRDGGTHTISFTTGGWANNPTMTITPGNPGAVGIGTTSAVYNNGWAERSIQIHALKKGSPGGLSYGAETIDDTYGPDFSLLRQRAVIQKLKRR